MRSIICFLGVVGLPLAWACLGFAVGALTTGELLPLERYSPALWRGSAALAAAIILGAAGWCCREERICINTKG